MKIAMIGFGEAARAIVGGWSEASDGLPGAIAAFDVKYGDPAWHGALVEATETLHVALCPSLGQALEGASIVFSLVTADRALEAASAAALTLQPGAYYLDCNSCAPSTKEAAASAVEAAGGRYCDVAIMAPIHPARHRTPMLASGSCAAAARDALAGLGHRVSVAGPAIGQASSIKMLRSVMIKGMEALSAECILAARRAGVESAVIASLQASDPGYDWEKRMAYNLERMMVHGARRAAEMKEVAQTLRDLGMPDRMTAAAVAWQSEVAGAGAEADNTLTARADSILETMSR